MDQPALFWWYAIAPLLLTCLFWWSTEFTHAQSLWNHVANLPNSWTNDPGYSFPHWATPILSTESKGTQFLCGFYCPDDNQTCYFSVLMLQNKDDTYDDGPRTPKVIGIRNPKVVWSANRDRHVGLNATLQLTQSGDMILADADGTRVWSSNTGGKSVSGLNLTEMGNLVLFNTSNAAIWQSFDHPTDCLLPGQLLSDGMKLTSSISESNLSRGLYSLVVGRNRFFASIISSPPQIYYQYNLGDDGHAYVQLMNGSFNGVSIPPEYTSWFMKLESDGHLKVYEWSAEARGGWEIVADLLTDVIGECGYPMACGRYGVCSYDQCSCLDYIDSDSNISFFKQADYRKPKLGCNLTSPLSCNSSQNQSLLDLKDLTYFAVEQLFQTQYIEKTDLMTCKNRCLTNCSCQAAVYQYNQSDAKRGGCLLLTDVFSLMAKEEWQVDDNYQLFAKVQKPKVPEGPPTPASSKAKTNLVTIILASSIGGSFSVICSLVACYLFLIKRKELPEEFDDLSVDDIAGLPTRFTYDELISTTNNFTNKLGEGGFGSVFRGTLGNGTEVAVKCLNGLGHVKKSFLAEVGTIGSIHHINLVRLVGFCAEKSQRLLVYEYMPNGSIDKWIFHKLHHQTLGWQSRRKIIIDIAKGLAYLHEECRNKIFHLDIKPQNILLDEDFSAKVADFGLAKLVDKEQSQVVTTMRGTPGYMAPEWLSSVITEKVDVYSFGVVVLEILCGRKNLDRSQPEEDMLLLGLFQRKAEEGRLIDIVDSYHEDMRVNGNEVVEMMRIAAWCLQTDFSRRPTMSLVVKVLEGSADVEQNLSYSFTNVAIRRTNADEGENHITNGETLLLPFSLSGPR